MAPEVTEIDLQAEAAGILSWLKQTSSATEGFVMEQAPLVAEEIVRWEFWSNSLMVLLLVLPFLIVFPCWITGIFLCIKYKADDEIVAPVVLGGGVVVVITFLIAAVGGSPHGLDALKAHTAPRLTIIDYVTVRM